MTAASEALSDVNGYGVFASRPAAGLNGRIYWASDTGAAYRDNGATWDTLIAGSSSLTVEEVDGSPTGAVTKIKFPNSTLAIVGGVATYTPAGGGDLVKLTETTLGADAADITITGISGAYKDLLIVCSLRTTKAATFEDCYLRVGSGSIDTAAHYAYYSNYWGSSSGANNANGSTGAYAGAFAAASNAASSFGGGEFWILDYASTTKQKQVSTRSFFYESAVVIYHSLGSTVWNQTTAVDQVRLYPLAGPNLKAGSRVAVYGRN